MPFKQLQKLVNKIKNYKHKQIIQLTASLVLGMVVAAVALPKTSQMLATKSSANRPSQLTQVSLGIIKPNQQTKTPVSLAYDQLSTYNGLPVSSVESHPVANAKGTAILIPQYHRDPSTQVSDPINDSAQRDQEQIYQVLQYLNQKGGINMMVLEGDMQGPVPQDKIDHTTQEMQAYNQLANVRQQLASAFNTNTLQGQAQQDLLNKIDQQLAATRRDLDLQGAPYVLKANGANVTLVGAENQQTIDQSTVVIRNYVYLQDRINQLQNPQAGAPMQQMQGGGNPTGLNPQMLAMVQQLMGHQDTSTVDFAVLTNAAKSQNNSSLTNLLSAAQQDMTSIKIATQPLPVNTNAPSRSDNPYANVTNLAQLESEFAQAQQQVNSLIIDTRNQEAAAAFAKSLQDHNQTVGVIQFGAGHEPGLVQDLNNQGISVIVVTTNETATRDSQQQTS